MTKPATAGPVRQLIERGNPSVPRGRCRCALASGDRSESGDTRHPSPGRDRCGGSHRGILNTVENSAPKSIEARCRGKGHCRAGRWHVGRAGSVRRGSGNTEAFTEGGKPGIVGRHLAATLRQPHRKILGYAVTLSVSDTLRHGITSATSVERLGGKHHSAQATRFEPSSNVESCAIGGSASAGAGGVSPGQSPRISKASAMISGVSTLRRTGKGTTLLPAGPRRFLARHARVWAKPSARASETAP